MSPTTPDQLRELRVLFAKRHHYYEGLLRVAKDPTQRAELRGLADAYKQAFLAVGDYP